MPVDFQAVLNPASTCTTWPRLSPFFNYLNTNHAEGPRKWYIAACPGDVAKVYLPAKGVLHDWGIRNSGSEQGREGKFNGEKVLINVQVRFDVSPRVTVFYMHLSLRDEIRAAVLDSPTGYAIFEAGTHIGYVYTPPNRVYSLDFGVQDLDKDSGLTQDPEDWWNTRANPLDYFTVGVRESILEAYQATYETLVEGGVTPYSDIADSRPSINHQDTIWGIWFKDDLASALGDQGRTNWSVVNLVKKADLHQETYWRTLEAFPTMSGLFVEETGTEVIGKALYEGRPVGVNKVYILSGNEVAGVARIEDDWGIDPPSIYLKYEVLPNGDSRFDDLLILESYLTQDVAEVSNFSDRAVTFRREPCRNADCR